MILTADIIRSVQGEADAQAVYREALKTDSSSVRRLSLNIVDRLEMKEEDLRSDLYDFCLDHAVDVEELPGIQAICMKIAYRISTFYPELMAELKRI